VISGEIFIELGDSWFIAKTMLVELSEDQIDLFKPKPKPKPNPNPYLNPV